ncbi:MAG: rod shape-determining protein MreD [Rickettsiales bacterium]
MRSVSDMLLLAAPTFIGVLLLLLFAMPLESVLPFSLAPNVCFVMTLVVATFCPPAWPRGVAFGLGLAQDVISGTPLGAQALLGLLLVGMVAANARRQQHQLFRVRWMEAAGVFLALHFVLWLLVRATTGQAPSPEAMLSAGVVSGLWYPLFYVLLRPFADATTGAA